jgi:hypothetical protein
MPATVGLPADWRNPGFPDPRERLINGVGFAELTV